MSRTYSQPVNDLAVDDVVSTLAAVTTAGGYPIDLLPERCEPGGNNPRHGSAVVILDSVAEGEIQPDGQDDHLLTVSVRVRVLELLASGVPIDRTLYTVAAAVAKAACIDRTRDGLAYWTDIGPVAIEEMDTTNNTGLVNQTLLVRTRTLMGDPFTTPYGT